MQDKRISQDIVCEKCGGKNPLFESLIIAAVMHFRCNCMMNKKIYFHDHNGLFDSNFDEIL